MHGCEDLYVCDRSLDSIHLVTLSSAELIR